MHAMIYEFRGEVKNVSNFFDSFSSYREFDYPSVNQWQFFQKIANSLLDQFLKQ